MLIGLIADTHVPEVARVIPPGVAQAFDGVDLILHAGDIAVASALDDLQRIAPVLAARGDDDYQIEDERIEDVQHLTFDGASIYVIHSSQYWARGVIERPEEHGLDRAPDAVIFGHTHRDWLETVGDSLLVNPGSASFPYYQLRPGTVALLTIGDGRKEARIVDLGDI
jgi:putative phosphoesterase